ncbi:MAG: right-handed parallel beta-helix repeat-containing protein [Verrucomicrobiae bacterium]|nr:right-handed parallel beta-helix repeat-containing protein [Verrucomicrobiae bacterium]
MKAFRMAFFFLFVFGLVLEAAPIGRRPPNDQAVREVAAGKRKEARASWWGFDPADSTAALQAAINSGAKKLVVENMGAPWIVDRIQLASDQEIVFQRGAVVQARRGAFKGKTDSLFSASLKRNITLTGYGATLRMWKQDYDDTNQYTRAEWRHVLNFRSCSRVRIAGLTLADSGGDGIYLGVAQRGVPCSDFVIKDVVCDNNYRQGISVISARNLLIENCVLKNTGGTAPMAGIDFEPNHESEELVNCVMRRCVSENNRGDAYVFYLRPLRASSKPISVRIENCRARGCRTSARFITGNENDAAAVKGTVKFINCQFEASKDAGIVIGDKPVHGAEVWFVNCAVINAATNQPAMTPIAFTSRAGSAGDIGGVRFINCAVKDPVDRLPMSYQDMSGGCGLRDITGTLTVQRGGKRVTHRLDDKLIAAWMPHRSFKQIARFDTEGARFEPILPAAKPDAAHRCKARQRGLCEFLIWAEAGRHASFTVLVRPVGKAASAPTPVSIVSPAGQLTKLKAAPAQQETAYSFDAAETGAHKIICEPGNSTVTVSSDTHRVCLYSASSLFHFLGTTGQYFFWVPPGTKEFAIKVSGENAAERVKAALCDSAGNKIEEKDNIAQAHQFVANPQDTSQGEIWSLRLDRPSTGVLEDFHVQLQGVPPVLSCSREALLKPVKEDRRGKVRQACACGPTLPGN